MIDHNPPATAHRKVCVVAMLLLFLLGSGCAKVAKSLAELSRLRAAIIAEFGEPDVQVNLNNATSLTVTFINSPLNTKGPDERKKRAEATAMFVKSHADPFNEMSEIWVGFIRQETRYIVVTYTEGLGFFGFDRNARPLSRPPEDPPTGLPDDSLRVIADYSSTSNQTEIMITSLQLLGTLSQVLALTPHFTVPGDAAGVRRSASFPQSVSFDLASYSEKPLFPGKTKIKFLADEKVVFETSEAFSTSKGQDGLFSESLLLQVPYPAFLRMTAGKKVTFMMGDNEYNLRDEQLKALREMTKYVGE